FNIFQKQILLFSYPSICHRNLVFNTGNQMSNALFIFRHSNTFVPVNKEFKVGPTHRRKTFLFKKSKQKERTGKKKQYDKENNLWEIEGKCKSSFVPTGNID